MNDMDIQDQELLHRIAADDRDAMNLFVAQWRPAIVRFTKTITRDCDPEDIAQEVLMNFYRKRVHIAATCEGGSIPALLFSMTRNAVLVSYRRRLRKKRNMPTISIDAPLLSKFDGSELPLQIPDRKSLPEFSAYADEMMGKIAKGIKHSPQAQTVLNLMVVHGMTEAEVERKTGLTRYQITGALNRITSIAQSLKRKTRQEKAYAFVQRIDNKLQTVSRVTQRIAAAAMGKPAPVAKPAPVIVDHDYLRRIITDYDTVIAKGKNE